MTNRTITVAAAQLGPIQRAEPRSVAVARMIRLLEQAHRRGVELVVFPELALTTFFPRHYEETIAAADHWFETAMPSNETAPLFDTARRLGIGFHLGFAEIAHETDPAGQLQKRRFNTAILVGPGGEILLKYRKIHLPGHAEFDPRRTTQHLEKRYFEVGNLGFPVIRAPMGGLDGINMGMMICNDRRWPEAWRVLGLQSVELVMLGYNTPSTNQEAGGFEAHHLRVFHSHLTIQAGCYQNACFAVATAKAGIEDGCELFGHSIIVNPQGEIIAMATSWGDELITADLDLDQCTIGRTTIFAFEKHRRPEAYQRITDQVGAVDPPVWCGPGPMIGPMDRNIGRLIRPDRSSNGRAPTATRSRRAGGIFRVLVCFLLAALTDYGVAHAAAPMATESDQFMVVSAQHLATEAGAEILRAGGNAIDAAVAMGYAEAVTNPCCGNIGGGGFLVAHLADGRDVFINFRETAPAGASAGTYLDPNGAVIPGASLKGWRAAGVPGTVLGLDTALARYGSLPRSKVMATAIRLARDGFILTRGDTDILARATSRLRQNAAIARIFLRSDGSPFAPGDRLIQADLANTLADIAANGPEIFYQGHIAAEVAGASGGALTEADFASYHVTEAKPLSCMYRGRVVLSAPPPSSGGTVLCEILNVLEGYDLEAMGFHSAYAVHIMVEAMRNAYADRNHFLGDPEFVNNPLQQLLSREHADQISGRIIDRATPSSTVNPGTLPDEQPQTTSYSVLDNAGNAVSVTYTLNGYFGGGVMAAGTGFLLNNEMDDFTIKAGVANMLGLVQGAANMIAPGKRPLSSMAPTIVLRNGRVAMVLGSPGGARIITTVLETILNVIDHGMSPQEAVDAPRLHHQFLPDTIYTERFALAPDTAVVLQAMGYTITEQNNWGAAALIAVGPQGEAPVTPADSPSDAAASGRMLPGRFYGAMDSRRPSGLAIGE